MKKILIITLVMTLILTLAACGGKNNEQDTTNDEGHVNGSGLTQQDINDANEAWDKLEELFYAEDWRWDGDYGYINGKWDEGVMYDPVPSPPDGMQITEMQYIGKNGQKWSDSTTIGDMYIDGSDYECISVDFDCSKAQLEEMVKSYTDAGWMMHFEESYGNGDMWHFYYGKEYYAYLRGADFMADDGYEIGAYLNVTPAYYELPKTVAGVKMPQCGILFGTGWLDGYDEEYNHIEKDFSPSTPVGSLPAKWLFACESYYGTTEEDVKTYRDEMVADGWELVSEYDEGSGYNITLKKGDVRIQCAAHGGYYMNIQIANDDNLYY